MTAKTKFFKISLSIGVQELVLPAQDYDDKKDK